MKIAFTTKGKDWGSLIDPRFGRTEYFLIYDEEKDMLKFIDNKESNKEAHGAGPKTAQKLFDIGANILITGNGSGGNAAKVIEKMGIKIFIGAGDMTAERAYKEYKNNKLKES
ncbi:MAG: NifB/NifX family molybdenum-iron cluster-binding protein [Bacteroidales bacterium]|nr:NifB/NifX family molybdenum-iron cluster-binding protein [Bacteroidales bacterium]